MRKNKLKDIVIYNVAPHKVLIYAWLIWIFFYILSPYHYIDLGVFWEAIIFLFIMNFSFYLGLILPQKHKKNKTQTIIKFNTPLKKTLNLIILLGTVGTILSVYLKLKLISEFSFDSMGDNKNELLEQGIQDGGLLNISAALLFPFGYASLILLLTYRAHIKRLKFFIFLFLSLLTPLFLLLLGSRATTFFYLFTALFTLLMTPSKGKIVNIKQLSLFKFLKRNLSLKKIITATIVAISSLILFTFIQSDRIESMSGDKLTFFNYWQENQKWEYNEEHPINMFLNEKPEKNLGVLNFIHYQVHGVYEFSRLYSYLDSKYGYFYSKYQFYPFFKFFEAIGIDTGADFYEMDKVKNRSGVFTTYWGPFYLDFGYFGIIIIFFVGRIIKKISLRYRQSFLSLMLYPFILSIIITSPILNTFTGGFLYSIVALLLTRFIFQFYVRKLN